MSIFKCDDCNYTGTMREIFVHADITKHYNSTLSSGLVDQEKNICIVKGGK